MVQLFLSHAAWDLPAPRQHAKAGRLSRAVRKWQWALQNLEVLARKIVTCEVSNFTRRFSSVTSIPRPLVARQIENGASAFFVQHVL